VVGLVVARQQPQTAKGSVFILMEDETGMANVIVHPDVYERDRLAIRGESFLWVKGKLAKDEGTVNVIAEEVRGLGVRRIGRPTPSGFSARSAPSRRIRKTGAEDGVRITTTILTPPEPPELGIEDASRPMPPGRRAPR
jgi:DNA polymerase III alpha subunit